MIEPQKVELYKTNDYSDAMSKYCALNYMIAIDGNGLYGISWKRCYYLWSRVCACSLTVKYHIVSLSATETSWPK